jgi:2-C-methyl-D-erythritol 4-phosphate cytidylyltransferase
VVVAGGTGTRFGGPKQLADLAGRSVVAWSVDAARSVADGVVLVVPDAERDAAPGDDVWPAADRVVVGGSTRAASVRAGLGAVPADAEVVVVHDAARPLATAALFARVVDHLVTHHDVEGVVPAVPVIDTIKQVAGDTVVATVDRGSLVAVQTPQAFRAVALRRAHAGDRDATDDAGLVEGIGGHVVVVPGERTNVKVTVPDDLVVARALVDAGGVAGAMPAAAGDGVDGVTRVGR